MRREREKGRERCRVEQMFPRCLFDALKVVFSSDGDGFFFAFQSDTMELLCKKLTAGSGLSNGFLIRVNLKVPLSSEAYTELL